MLDQQGPKLRPPNNFWCNLQYQIRSKYFQ